MCWVYERLDHMQATYASGPTSEAAHENAKRDRKERVKCYDLIVFREENYERPDAACS
jgi:hypothetical protein